MLKLLYSLKKLKSAGEMNLNIAQIGINYKRNEFNNFCIEGINGKFILYIIKSPVVFYLNSEYIYKPENSFIILDENVRCSIMSCGQEFIYDRLIINAESTSDCFIPPNIRTNNVYALSSCVKTDELFNILINESYNLRPDGKDLICKCLSSIFLTLGQSITQDLLISRSPYYETLLEIRRNIHKFPSKKWTVDSICRKANLSRSYFQLLYREAFGITCINDVIESKVDLARKLLDNSNDTVSSIASQCGYDNDVHFMRQFKKLTGVTPSEYRKSSNTKKRKAED